MPTLDCKITICEWGSQHSNRSFDAWHTIALPCPAKLKTPNWHKHTPTTVDGSRTIKKCMPVTDVMNLGYIIPAPVDIRVYRNNEDDLLFDDSDGEFFVTRHAPEQYGKTHFGGHVVLKFDFPWVLNTPPGYSLLYTHPMYRDNSKLEALPAFVSTDTYYNSTSCPVIVKDWKIGEVLEIAKGTPLVQAIPMLREDWEIKTDFVEWGKMYKTAGALAKNESAYRDTYRQKKKDV